MKKNPDYKVREFVYFNTAEEMQRYIESLEGNAPAPGSRVTILLPSATDFFQLLGFSGSVPSLFEQISEQKKVALPFSRATLFKLPKYWIGKESIGKATQRKFLDFVWNLFPRKQQKLIGMPKHFTGGAGELWQGLVLGIKNTVRATEELAGLVDFLEQRMDQEHYILMNMRNAALDQNSKENLYIDLLKQHTRLPEDVINLVSELVVNQSVQLSAFEKAKVACSTKLDFYFSLIACLEIGWLNKISIDAPEVTLRQSDWFQNGIIHKFIKKLRFLDNDEIWLETPFSLYLEWLADIAASKSNLRFSDAKLASYIPIEQEEDTAGGYTKSEKQKDLLKDWKNSKYPSPKKLSGFIQNLVGALCGDTQFLIEIGLSAIILDKLFLELFHGLRNEGDVDCYKALEQSVTRYKEYFQHYHAMYSKWDKAAA